MICSRADVALVPFQFTDHSAAKRRPVLVLTDPDGYGSGHNRSQVWGSGGAA